MYAPSPFLAIDHTSFHRGGVGGDVYFEAPSGKNSIVSNLALNSACYFRLQCLRNGMRKIVRMVNLPGRRSVIAVADESFQAPPSYSEPIFGKGMR